MSKNIDKYSIDNTDYTVGQDNVQKWGFDVHNPVFGFSLAIIAIFLIAAAVIEPATAKKVLDGAKWDIINNFDWLFIWSANFFLVFIIAIAVSPFGKIRLGGNDATPEHSVWAWLAMLFAAGMGIGLVFWGVAEPVAYFTGWFHTPLNVTANSPEAAQLALGATMYHWGLHPWAIYGIVALALAFFTYNKGLPLSMRSIFYPILGDRAWGWTGHVIDILAVIATLFGLATSLGLGAQQAAGGINLVFGLDNGLSLQIGIIILVTLIAIFSVWRGIDSGVKLLSNINMVIAFALLIAVAIIGYHVSFASIWITLTSYAENILPLSNTFGREDTDWFHGWTVFYWAWWISWSPFVGMFIARVSKGRTIREFVVAVLLVPTIVTLIWMSVFGGIAIDQVIHKVGELGTQGLTDISLAMFQMFDKLIWGKVLSVIAVALVLVFFVTSSDSGSLVIDSITAGGKLDAPVTQRVLWALIGGLIAVALLWIGGANALQAMQAAIISTALPFTLILLCMCLSLFLGLKTEKF